MLNCACPNISFPLNEKNSTKLPSKDPYNFQFVHYQHIRTYQMRGDIFSKTCKESSKIDIQTIQSRKMAPFNFYIFCHMIASPAEKSSFHSHEFILDWETIVILMFQISNRTSIIQVTCKLRKLGTSRFRVMKRFSLHLQGRHLLCYLRATGLGWRAWWLPGRGTISLIIVQVGLILQSGQNGLRLIQ